MDKPKFKVGMYVSLLNDSNIFRKCKSGMRFRITCVRESSLIDAWVYDCRKVNRNTRREYDEEYAFGEEEIIGA